MEQKPQLVVHREHAADITDAMLSGKDPESVLSPYENGNPNWEICPVVKTTIRWLKAQDFDFRSDTGRSLEEALFERYVQPQKYGYDPQETAELYDILHEAKLI